MALPSGNLAHPLSSPKSQALIMRQIPGLLQKILCISLLLFPLSLWAKGKKTWVDQSPILIDDAIQAMALTPNAIWIGGQGWILKSLDQGLSWTPVLKIYGPSLDFSQTFVQNSPEDLQNVDAIEDSEQFREIQEALLESLSERYGEDVAEEMILEMQDDIEEQALQDLLEDMEAEMDQRQYQQRLQKWIDSGLTQEEAAQKAGALISVWNLVTDPEQPNMVYAATAKGLFQSLGQSWKNLSKDWKTPPCFDLVVSHRGQWLFALNEQGLVFSKDGGLSWTEIQGPWLRTLLKQLAWLDDQSLLWVSNPKGFWVSKDLGTSWKAIELPPELGHLHFFYIAPDHTLWIASDQGVARSKDFGKSWIIPQNKGLEKTPFHDLVQDSEGTLYLASDRGPWISKDLGEHWKNIAQGLIHPEVYRLDLAPDHSLWALGKDGLSQWTRSSRAAQKLKRIQKLKKIWQSEPSLAHTLFMAFDFAQLDLHHYWIERLRLSLFLPKIFFSYKYSAQRKDLEYVTYQMPPNEPLSEAYFYSQRRQSEIIYPQKEWRLMFYWDLGDALFNTQELAVIRTQAQIQKARLRLAKKVTRLYLRRRRIQMRLAKSSPKSKKWIKHYLKLREFTALLDAYTGGAFVSALPENTDQLWLQTSF